MYNININNIWLQKHIESIVATIAYTKHTKSMVKHLVVEVHKINNMNAYLQKHTKTIATPLSYKCTQKQQLQMKLKK